MGKVVVNVKLANATDVDNAEAGLLDPGDVRRCEVEAVADSGATLMCRPEEVVEQLGLRELRTEMARLATGERRRLSAVATARIEIGDRVAHQGCVMLPRGTQPLVGHWVLQEMDLVLDCRRERLAPGHPETDGPMMDLL